MKPLPVSHWAPHLERDGSGVAGPGLLSSAHIGGRAASVRASGNGVGLRPCCGRAALVRAAGTTAAVAGHCRRPPSRALAGDIPRAGVRSPPVGDSPRVRGPDSCPRRRRVPPLARKGHRRRRMSPSAQARCPVSIIAAGVAVLRQHRDEEGTPGRYCILCTKSPMIPERNPSCACLRLFSPVPPPLPCP